MISVTQLKSANENDSYDKYKSHYPESIEVEKNTKFEKFYEIEKIINKRVKKYGKTNVTQYFIRWIGYEPEFDE